MKSTRYTLAVALGLIALVVPNAVRADSITESITILGSMPVLGTVPTSQFAAFNPALGTLASISVSLSGTLNYTGMGIPMDEGASLALQGDPRTAADSCSLFGGIDDCIFIPALGSGLPFSFAMSGITDPTTLSDYSGTGLRDFDVSDFAGNFTDHISMAGQGSVTFNYTPPVPEPSSILLLGTGLLGLMGMTLRRKRLA